LTLKNTRTEDYPTNKTVLGDPIVWIGDTVTITVPITKINADNGNCSTTATTTMVVSPPKINGFRLGEDDQLLRCRRQKKIEAAFMLKLGHGSVVVDAGAHLGDTVLTLAVHARAKNRSDLRFVAVEPCSEKCEFILSVVAANNLLENVKVWCAALGDSVGVVKPESSAKKRAKRDGSLRYEYCHSNERPVSALDVTGAAVIAAAAATKNQNDDGAQIIKSYGIDESSSIGNESNSFGGDTESEGDNTINIIPIITLDSIFDQISPLGMLHIDVEGWESNVLRGAKKSLTTIPDHCSNKCNNDDESDDYFPCFIVAEAWTKKESLRRGVSGNAEEKIIGVMEDEVNDDGDAGFRFERIDDIVDIERNLVYFRKRKGNG
jgi:FkbM family methyltransferase